MRSMTVQEAQESFDRILAIARQEVVVLREDNVDVAAFIPAKEYARFRKWLVDGLLKAARELAAEAEANGPTEEKLAEILNERP